jgi:hypothetical protein
VNACVPRWFEHVCVHKCVCVQAHGIWVCLHKGVHMWGACTVCMCVVHACGLHVYLVLFVSSIWCFVLPVHAVSFIRNY